jgi:hypothetical protein
LKKLSAEEMPVHENRRGSSHVILDKEDSRRIKLNLPICQVKVFQYKKEELLQLLIKLFELLEVSHYRAEYDILESKKIILGNCEFQSVMSRDMTHKGNALQ